VKKDTGRGGEGKKRREPLTMDRAKAIVHNFIGIGGTDARLAIKGGEKKKRGERTGKGVAQRGKKKREAHRGRRNGCSLLVQPKRI